MSDSKSDNIIVVKPTLSPFGRVLVGRLQTLQKHPKWRQQLNDLIETYRLSPLVADNLVDGLSDKDSPLNTILPSAKDFNSLTRVLDLIGYKDRKASSGEIGSKWRHIPGGYSYVKPSPESKLLTNESGPSESFMGKPYTLKVLQPRITTRSDGRVKTVVHTEIFFTNNPGVSGETIQVFDISPRSEMFTKLASESLNYEFYKFKRIHFRLISQQFGNVRGSNTLAFDYDASDSYITDPDYIRNISGSITRRVVDDIKLSVDMVDANRIFPHGRVMSRVYTSGAVQDRTLEIGKLYLLSTVNNSSSRFHVEVSYEIDFYRAHNPVQAISSDAPERTLCVSNSLTEVISTPNVNLPLTMDLVAFNSLPGVFFNSTHWTGFSPGWYKFTFEGSANGYFPGGTGPTTTFGSTDFRLEKYDSSESKNVYQDNLVTLRWMQNNSYNIVYNVSLTGYIEIKSVNDGVIPIWRLYNQDLGFAVDIPLKRAKFIMEQIPGTTNQD